MKTHRGYIVKPHPTFPSSYVISTEGVGGSIHSSLEGLFTSTSVAFGKIDLYLDYKEDDDGRKSSKTVKQG